MRRCTSCYRVFPSDGLAGNCACPHCNHMESVEVPSAVTESIRRAWPDQADNILKSLKFSGDHYSFDRWGMYVGVEFDGYIHT